MKVSDIVAKILKEEGIPCVFGYPGGEVTSFLDSLKKEGIRFILTKHESTAAFMAAATGEISGKPGVCLSTLGPGATNLITGVAHAYLDRAPVIAITGNMATNFYEVSTHQHLDLVRLFEPVSKWSATIEASSVERILSKAFAIAMSPKQGPVHLTFPSNVALMEKEKMNYYLSKISTESTFSGDISASLKIINNSKKPIIFAGLGVLRCNAHQEFVKFVEKLGAPVIITPKAKGIIPENHLQFLGVIEMLCDRIILDYAKNSDLIITIGFDVVEMDKQWMFGETPVIDIDNMPNTDKYYPTQLELHGNISKMLEVLTRQVNRASWDINDIKSVRENLIKTVATKKSEAMESFEVVKAARRTMPYDTIAVSDVGAHKMLVGQIWETYEPKTFFMSNGLSSMGSGIPTAMAAKLYFPKKPVIAIIGDGCFGMNMAELETMVREDIPIIIIVLDDKTLSLIKMNQERKGLMPYGVEFTNPDMVKLAESFGAVGYKVERIKELEDILKKELNSKKPVVIQAVIDPRSYRN
ncbi:thiamine pyrophosphate-binding protein [Tepidanaerobacter syntrophicus]|uniref:Acetolactate synthase-1/2/3 large subunit n=1 Tax=Tepidanaerobacter syntrophicus TaxID=224999 RepID=A0A0U9I4D8_9FIRM|nr:thiamine pyrophosphate-binding protein [Tepidanaerobacter syntrophicus]GAQ25160.1 acetolactate synthase-1/2/3 large subunit [Tepidanaerobacter syntrophicus]